VKRRIANLPLHGGKAPAWLFKRMAALAGGITMAVVDEFGPEEMLRRLSDPWWFQAFGCVLGFDWHSSGVTTVTCGALGEAYRRFGDDLGIVVAGGKGRASRKTPHEIADAASRLGIAGGDRLVYASRMSAKVDSAAVQDGYQIYHHSFFLVPRGAWCVVQQGMNEEAGYARRYHWLGETVSDFVCEPHNAVEDVGSGAPGSGALSVKLLTPSRPHANDSNGKGVRSRTHRAPDPYGPDPDLLNMVASEADASRKASAALVRERPDWLLGEVERLTEGPTLFAPAHHPVLPQDVNRDHLRKAVTLAHERNPQDFESLLGTREVGPVTVRSLALLAEVIYNAPASHRDPAEASRRKWADYSYAHGGKDGHPFPVDRKTYDRNIEILLSAVRRSRIGDVEKTEALKRLARIAPGI